MLKIKVKKSVLSLQTNRFIEELFSSQTCFIAVEKYESTAMNL